MKNIFKKIAVIALAMIMCVGAAMPVTFAADAKCPGEGNIHTSVNCEYRVIAQVEASCEAEGFVTGQCNGCAVTFVVNSVEKLGHDWEAAEVNCMSASTKTCKRCGKEETIPGTATGHAYGEWITKGENGCFIGNRRYRVCSACGDVQEETMKEVHSWVVAIYVAPVDCKTPGKAAYVCENSGCDAKKTADIWAKSGGEGHDYRKWDSTDADVLALTNGRRDPNLVSLSCVKDGARTEICVDCGDVIVIYTSAKTYKHTLDDMKYTEATLDVNGCAGSFKMPYWECYACGLMLKDLTADEYKELNVVETFYAKWGTVSPVIKSDDYKNLTSEQKSEYYAVYYQYDWKGPDYYAENEPDVIFADGTHFKAITATETWWGDGHQKKTVAATCTTDGYEEINCKKCGKYSFTTKAALGHKYYGDVTKDDDKKAVLKDLGISYTTLSTTWSNVGNVGKADGCGKVWNKVYLPTCNLYASVEWRCLNGCDETKSTPLTGTRNAPYGHNYEEIEVLAATCTNTGLCDNICSRPVQSYVFSGSTKVVSTEKVEGTSDDLVCGKIERKSIPALGHTFIKDEANVENKAVSCKDDGLQFYVCANGCGETKKEVVVSTGEEHLWSYYSYVTENTEPTCLNESKGYAVCTKCDMIEPQLIVKEALGHKYVEIDDEAKKLLKAKGDELYVDEAGKLYDKPGTGRVLAAELVTVGSCVESAIYRIYCQRDNCNINTVEIPDAENVKTKHNIAVVTYYYNEKGEYDPNANNDYDDGAKMLNGIDCVNKTTAYYWYCKNKDCIEYRTENFQLLTASKWVDKYGNPATLKAFESYGTHFDPETGDVITYKDVADERISTADDMAAAQAVTAPVDENGNVIAYAVEIPGTTLVWRYAIDDVTCDNDQVTYGGFYCVKCDNSKYTAAEDSPKATVGNTRAAFHTLKKGDTVDATCLTYGYTPYSCKNCDYTVQYDYKATREAHDIDLTSPISVVGATCEAAGARIYQCQYNDCRQFVTIVDAPLGHSNVSGDALLRSCLDTNANIENRRCANCSLIILSEHQYVNGICVECGAPKED